MTMAEKKEPDLYEGTFREEDLVIIAEAPPPDYPPLVVGDYCWFISGSPRLLVVEANGDDLVVSWANGEKEGDTHRCCVRKTNGVHPEGA